jgi:hypothetical protein
MIRRTVPNRRRHRPALRHPPAPPAHQIADAPPGTFVHVIATDPAAPLDLPAWCHMTGHTYLGPVPGERPVYALRLTADARATRPDAPWHPLRRQQKQPRSR